MKRRPHWDDDLIEAVSCLVSVDIGDDCLVVADVYAIIAAVEDWHEKFVMHGAFRVLAERAASAEADRDRLANQLLNEVPDSYIQMKARALTAEAAIARVRELRDRFATHEKSISYQAAATLLTRALDGDGPGCQGTPDKTGCQSSATNVEVR